MPGTLKLKSEAGGSVILTANTTAASDLSVIVPPYAGTLATLVSNTTAPYFAQAGIAGNGPAFFAWMYNGGSTYSVTSGTDTVVPLDTKVYDTNNCFNNTGSAVTLNGISVPAYSFAPNVAGYYQVNTLFRVTSSGASTVFTSYIWKNGSAFFRPLQVYGAATNTQYPGSCIVYLNGIGDYLTFAGNIQATSPQFGYNGSTSSCSMMANLIRSA